MISGGNHFHLQGFLAALENMIAHAGGQVAVDHAQDHWLDLEIVHKVRNAGYAQVDGKGDVHHGKLGLSFVDHGRYVIHAARAAAMLDGIGKDKAVDGARSHGSKNRAAAIACVIHEAANVDDVVLHQEQRAGKNQHVYQRFQGEVAVNTPKCHGEEGNVDEQRHVTNAEVEHVLNHRVDAAQPCGGEGIVENEYLIVERHQHGQRRHDDVVHYLRTLLRHGHTQFLLCR